MDFRSAVETLAEAWVAANSPSPLTTNMPYTAFLGRNHNNHETNGFRDLPSPAPSESPPARSNSSAPDTSSSNGCSSPKATAIPIHCVIEAACPPLDDWGGGGRNNPPTVYRILDAYAIIPAAVCLVDLVTTALGKLGFPKSSDAISAKGTIQIKNWKPLVLEQVTDDPQEATVGDILGDLVHMTTLRIVLSGITPEGEKLLQLAASRTLVHPDTPPSSHHTSPVDIDSNINESRQPSSIQDSSMADVFNLFRNLAKNNTPPSLGHLFVAQQGALALPEIMAQTKGLLARLGNGNGTLDHTQQHSHNSSIQKMLQSVLLMDGKAPVLPHIPRSTLVDRCKENGEVKAISSQPAFQSARDVSDSALDFSSSSTTLRENTSSGLRSDTSGGESATGTSGVGSFYYNEANGSAMDKNSTTAIVNLATKPRVRTTFDPELEVPMLHAWFARDQHPSRVQIQQYVHQLNANRRATNRDKLLNVNNVVYWFKNARAAFKRRKQASKMGGALSVDGSTVSAALSGNLVAGVAGSKSSLKVPCDDGERKWPTDWHRMLDERGLMDMNAAAAASWCPDDLGGSPPSPDTSEGDPETLDLSVKKPSPSKKPKTMADITGSDGGSESASQSGDELMMDESNDDEDDDATEASDSVMQLNLKAPEPNITAVPVSSSVGVTPPIMFNPLLAATLPASNQQNGAAGVANTSINAPSSSENIPSASSAEFSSSSSYYSCRKRNRTFIDPVTEVPKLERWFNEVTTHPHHAQIDAFTAELNSMEYRSKFPKLEPRNVQFWFKNRRAKCKRIEKAQTGTSTTNVGGVGTSNLDPSETAPNSGANISGASSNASNDEEASSS